MITMKYMYSQSASQFLQPTTNFDCFKICESAGILLKLVKAFRISRVPPFSKTIV